MKKPYETAFGVALVSSILEAELHEREVSLPDLCIHHQAYPATLQQALDWRGREELVGERAPGNPFEPMKLVVARARIREWLHEQTIRPALPPSGSAVCMPNLHPLISAECGSLFADGHYAQAVTRALLAANQRVRGMTGRTDYGGVDMSRQIFGKDGKKGDRLILGPGTEYPTSKTGFSIQEELRCLFKAAS